MVFFKKTNALMVLGVFLFGALDASQKLNDVPLWAISEIKRIEKISEDKKILFLRDTIERMAILIDSACVKSKIDRDKNKINLCMSLRLLYEAFGEATLRNSKKIGKICLSTESYFDYCSRLISNSLPENSLRDLIRSKGNNVGLPSEVALDSFKESLERHIKESLAVSSTPEVKTSCLSINLVRRLPDGRSEILIIQDGDQPEGELPRWVQDVKNNLQVECRKTGIAFSGSMLEAIIASFDILIGGASDERENFERAKMVSCYYLRMQKNIVDHLSEKELIIFPQAYKESENIFITAMKMAHFEKSALATDPNDAISNFTDKVIRKALELECEFAASVANKDAAQSLAALSEQEQKGVRNFLLHQKFAESLYRTKSSLLTESRVRKVSFEKEIFDRLVSSVYSSYEQLGINEREGLEDVFSGAVERLYYAVGGIMNKEKRSFDLYVSNSDEYTGVFLDAISSLSDESLKVLVKNKGPKTGIVAEDGLVIFQKNINEYLEKSLDLAKLVKRATKAATIPDIEKIVVGKDGRVSGLTVEEFNLLTDSDPSLSKNREQRPNQKNKREKPSQLAIVSAISHVASLLAGEKNKDEQVVQKNIEPSKKEKKGASQAVSSKALSLKDAPKVVSVAALQINKNEKKELKLNLNDEPVVPKKQITTKKNIIDLQKELFDLRCDLSSQEASSFDCSANLDTSIDLVNVLTRKQQKKAVKSQARSALNHKKHDAIDSNILLGASTTELQQDTLEEKSVECVVCIEATMLPKALDDRAIALKDLESGLNIVRSHQHDPYSPSMLSVSSDDFGQYEELVPRRERLMVRGRGVTARWQ